MFPNQSSTPGAQPPFPPSAPSPVQAPTPGTGPSLQQPVQAPTQQPQAPQAPAAPQQPQNQPAIPQYPPANEPSINGFHPEFQTNEPQTPGLSPWQQLNEPAQQPQQPQPPQAPPQLPPQPGQQQPPAPQPNQPQNPQQPQIPGVQPPQQQPPTQYDAMLQNYMAPAGNQEPQLPNVADVKADDPQDLVRFFNEFATGIEQRIERKYTERDTAKRTETKLWNDTFVKYPQLKEDANLRAIVHSIRMGAIQQGVNMTPEVAADKLAEIVQAQYQNGYQAHQTNVRVQQSQPLSGGGQQPPQVTPQSNQQMLSSVQKTGIEGEQAVITAVDNLIQQGLIQLEQNQNKLLYCIFWMWYYIVVTLSN